MADNKWQERRAKKQRFWEVHIRAWKRSGFSQNDYCRRNQLNNGQLCYWKKKLGKHSATSLSFVPVPVVAPDLQAISPGGDSGLTICLAHSIRIGVKNDFTPATLIKLIDALGGRP